MIVYLRRRITRQCLVFIPTKTHARGYNVYLPQFCRTQIRAYI